MEGLDDALVTFWSVLRLESPDLKFELFIWKTKNEMDIEYLYISKSRNVWLLKFFSWWQIEVESWSRIDCIFALCGSLMTVKLPQVLLKQINLVGKWRNRLWRCVIQAGKIWSPMSFSSKFGNCTKVLPFDHLRILFWNLNTLYVISIVFSTMILFNL